MRADGRLAITQLLGLTGGAVLAADWLLYLYARGLGEFSQNGRALGLSVGALNQLAAVPVAILAINATRLGLRLRGGARWAAFTIATALAVWAVGQLTSPITSSLAWLLLTVGLALLVISQAGAALAARDRLALWLMLLVLTVVELAEIGGRIQDPLSSLTSWLIAPPTIGGASLIVLSQALGWAVLATHVDQSEAPAPKADRAQRS